MKNIYHTPAEIVAAEKKKRAAINIQRILKIEDDEADKAIIADALEQSLLDAQANNPADVCDMMILQTHMLDGLFQNCVENGVDTPEKLYVALKAQNQLVRTAVAWKLIKTNTYITHKIVKHYAAEKNGAERTEQNDFFHRPDTPHGGGVADDGIG